MGAATSHTGDKLSRWGGRLPMGTGGHWSTGKSQHVSGPTTETPLVGDDGPRVPHCRASLTSQCQRHKGNSGWAALHLQAFLLHPHPHHHVVWHLCNPYSIFRRSLARAGVDVNLFIRGSGVSAHGSKPSCLSRDPHFTAEISAWCQATVWRTTSRHANRQKSSNFFVSGDQSGRLIPRVGLLGNRWS